MATHDYIISNASGAAVRADLNNALAAIATNNSSATEPTTTYAYQWWADTGSSPTVMKLRNAANSGWITLFQLDGEWTVVPFENGTAAAPSIYFKDSGTDTGIYSPGTDQVAITTGGTGRLFVTSSGSVGIGSSTPSALLSVYQSSAGEVANFGTNDPTRAFRIVTGTANSIAGALITLKTDSAEGEIAFGTGGGTERVRITNAGRVGIGTTVPGSFYPGANDLVVGNTTAEAGITIAGGSSTNSNIYFADGTSGAAAYAGIVRYTHPTDNLSFWTAGQRRVDIDSSGRLLVGTSSALTGTDTQYSRFVVAGNTSGASAGIMSISRPEAATSITTDEVLGIISFADSGAGEYGRISCAADANAGTNDYPGRLVFSTTGDGASSPLERLRIDAGGLFKYGTYNIPTGVHEFNWQGANRFTFNNRDTTAANCYGLVINYTGGAPNNTGNEFLYCQDNTAVRFVARANGGLANYQANNVNLSDRNAKKDISPAADTWDCIKEWEIVNYRYKDQQDDADLNLGVIAQQIAESCPEVITVFQEAKEAKPAVLDDDENEIEAAQEAQPEKLGVKEQQMYWMAIKALQEAQARIETLEAKVAALESA